MLGDVFARSCLEHLSVSILHKSTSPSQIAHLGPLTSLKSLSLEFFSGSRVGPDQARHILEPLLPNTVLTLR